MVHNPHMFVITIIVFREMAKLESSLNVLGISVTAFPVI